MNDDALPEVPAARLGRQARLSLVALAGYGVAVHALLYAVTPAGQVLGAGAALLAWLIPLRYAARLWSHPAAAVRAHARVLVCVLVAGPAFALLSLPVTLVGLPLCAGLALIGSQRALAGFRASAPARGVRLSVSIICKDEADRLPRCLAAVHGWADEIVVLDSGSRDGTPDIARRYTTQVFETDWPGFGMQKQRALERCTGDWVLSLDADEVPSAALKQEIDAWLASQPGVAGFRILRGSVVFGGPVVFGADGDHHVRLFRRTLTRFDLKPVHEDVIVDGRIGQLEAPLWHYTFRDAAHMRSKFRAYAELQARQRHAQGRRATLPGALARAVVNFVLMYAWRLGVLDGWRGLVMALAYARYTFDKYALLRALDAPRGAASP